MGNAIKFTPVGTVTLQFAVRPDARAGRVVLVIEVEDTGIGISADDHAHVFDPFVQVSPATLQKGTGLGLAITRRYVELMGGQVTLASTLGQGTTVRAEVPVELADAADLPAAAVDRGRRVR